MTTPPGGPLGYPPAPYAGSPPRDHPRATTALVLGLVAIVGGITCYVPLLLGPWAWAVGRGAVRAIDADPYRYGGRGPAVAGYVLGVISTVLLFLAILALAGLLVFFVATRDPEVGPIGGVDA